MESKCYVQKVVGSGSYISYNVVNNGANTFIVRSTDIAFFDGKKTLDSYIGLPNAPSHVGFFIEDNVIENYIKHDIEMLVKDFGVKLG